MNTNRKNSPYLRIVLTVIKYGFSLFSAVLAFGRYGMYKYLPVLILELLIIILLGDTIHQKYPKLGYAVGSSLTALFNMQCWIFYYTKNFLNLLMLENIASVRAQSGHFLRYGLTILAIAVISYLKVVQIFGKKVKPQSLLSVVLIFELVVIMWWGTSYSAAYGLMDIAKQYRMNRAMSAASAGTEDMTYRFKKNSENAVARPADLPESPNIILIMAEGLSQNIVADERNIMPFLREWEDRSVFFENYYNHSFATYRGIIGQLYSGYQLNNYDTNTLVSMQDILRRKGYYTSFINVEPVDMTFINYLESLGFDEVDSNMDLLENDGVNYITDKNAFRYLLQKAEENAKSDKPFFTMMYSFQTHDSINSKDEQFGDGSNYILNKFHNLDCQVASFMESFEKSPLAENTVVIFTTDHATYAGDEFRETFPAQERPCPHLDEIPFLIYYPGIEPQRIDASGRNSLDMAPTVLDYLDKENEAYFLGVSLFMQADEHERFNHYFYDSVFEYSSAGDVMTELTGTGKEVFDRDLQQYLIAKTQPPK